MSGEDAYRLIRWVASTELRFSSRPAYAAVGSKTRASALWKDTASMAKSFSVGSGRQLARTPSRWLRRKPGSPRDSNKGAPEQFLVNTFCGDAVPGPVPGPRTGPVPGPPGPAPGPCHMSTNHPSNKSVLKLIAVLFRSQTDDSSFLYLPLCVHFEHIPFGSWLP